MSVVTDVVLFFSLGEDRIEHPNDDEYLIVNQINAWLQERRYGTLNCLDKYTGGNKATQACIYGGSFNFFDTDDFLEFLKMLPWQDREAVQLMIQNEGADKFRMVELSG
jgi:hypothetical protein